MSSSSCGVGWAALFAGLFMLGCGSKSDTGLAIAGGAGAPDRVGDSSSSGAGDHAGADTHPESGGSSGAAGSPASSAGRTSAGGASFAEAGSPDQVAPSEAGTGGDDGDRMSSAGASPTTLPPGFTAADAGGYRLGDPITPGDPTGGAGSSNGSNCGSTILAVIRDFKADGQNFEGPGLGEDRGLVKPNIGADRKPIFAPSGPTPTVADPAQFDDWFRDVDGLNLPYSLQLWFAPNAGSVSFDSSAFFPLDGAGFGNEGKAHNFHFTTEIHSRIKYGGGEMFSFIGDDDVWVFINDKLAIDLGGVHAAEAALIDLDLNAEFLGLKVGQVYSFDMFQAERHTSDSNFRIDTTLDFVDCGVVAP